MKENERKKIGFACAYTPLAIIDAAGFAPYRILPIGDWPDQAGQLLHDNLCPHIKRILDRAMDKDLPALAGMVFINSCDAMRRLADAWRKIRPEDRVIFLDLPATKNDNSVKFYGQEIKRFAKVLGQWSGNEIDGRVIEESLSKYLKLSELFQVLKKEKGRFSGGSAEMQKFYNMASTNSAEYAIDVLEKAVAEIREKESSERQGVPVYLFGNMLPDPEVYTLFESCGAEIAGDDFCTGSRLFGLGSGQNPEKGEADIFKDLAARMLSHPPCARTFEPQNPGKLAQEVLENAKACEAKGVICHTIKFCDPYLARLPIVRDTMREAGIPFLAIEGDCTLRSMGQQKTRIEAFIEMLR